MNKIVSFSFNCIKKEIDIFGKQTLKIIKNVYSRLKITVSKYIISNN